METNSDYSSESEEEAPEGAAQPAAAGATRQSTVGGATQHTDMSRKGARLKLSC